MCLEAELSTVEQDRDMLSPSLTERFAPATQVCLEAPHAEVP